jgi:hypothetical protein
LLLKILSLSLTSSHLYGIIFQNKSILGHFSLALQDLKPNFIKNLGFDDEDLLIASSICDHSCLYKETTFTKAPKTPIKKLLPLYEKSLFPLEETPAIFLSEVTKIQKTLLIQTNVVIKKSSDEVCQNLIDLGLKLDYLSSWQIAFHQSIIHCLGSPKRAIFFYKNDNSLFVLECEESHIYFSTILKILPLQKSSLESGIRSLKESSGNKNISVLFIGDDHHIEELLIHNFSDVSKPAISELEKRHFLEIGTALAASKNKYNFLKRSAKIASFHKLFKKLSLLNTAASLILFGLTSIALVVNNSDLKNHLKSKEISDSPLIISKNDIIQMTHDLEQLNSLGKYIPQLPSPGDLLAFFSSDPILQNLDSATQKSPFCQQLDYELIDLNTAKVKLICSFPNPQSKQEFEKNLKIKKIQYQTSKFGHLTHYEFIFKKGFVF